MIVNSCYFVVGSGSGNRVCVGVGVHPYGLSGVELFISCVLMGVASLLGLKFSF